MHLHLHHKLAFLGAHQVALGVTKLALGASGMIGSVLTAWRIDPEHAKAVILAVGGGCFFLVYTAMRDLIPLYIARRKDLEALNIDLAEMRRKAADAAARLHETDSRIEMNAAAIEAAKREAAEKAVEVERRAAERRHAMADALQRDLALRQEEILELKQRLAEQEKKFTLNGSAEAKHAVAINIIADDVHLLGDSMEPAVPVSAQHVDPPPPPGGPS